MKYSKKILITLVLIVVTDAIWLITLAGDINIDNATYISTLLKYFSIAIFILIAYKDGFGNYNIPKSIQNLFKFWLFWNILSLIRGAFLATNYWDWKTLFLSSFSFALIPLVFFFGKNITIAKIIFKFIFKYLFPFGFLFIPLTLVTNEELYSRLMIPISLFILFIPFIKYKWRLLIIIVAVTSILMVISFRSNIIKISFSILILIVYYFQNNIDHRWLRIVHLSLFVIPIVLFTLALTGTYNIFSNTAQNDEYYTINKRGDEENYFEDSRTFLYSEILSSISKTGNWLIGESAIGSYQTDFFYDDGGAMKGKRNSSEVGILNILLYNGVIGVLCYCFLLYTVSSIAINHSSNVLAKMLGLFIAFRWTYSFIEEFTQFDLNFYFFWFAVGLVSSTSFRNMNNKEIRNYFESI